MLTKEKLKKYLYDNWHIGLEKIAKDLSIKEKEIDFLKKLLKELEKENWIISYKNEEGKIEYEPSDAQELYTNKNKY
jgi:hypothetical protein